MAEPVSRSTTIFAAEDVIFAILADPRRHVAIDGSGTLQRALSAPDRLTLGARFGMAMRYKVPYRIRNTVVEFEEGRLIAWRHLVRHVWRYELEPLEPAEDGTPRTKVTETFDPRPALAPWLLARSGMPARNAVAIERTLQRLRSAAESQAWRSGRSCRAAGPAPGR